jgi:hypothetical protein
MPKLLTILTFTLLIFEHNRLAAGPVEELLENRSRPTMAQVKEVYDARGSNPMRLSEFYGSSWRLELIQKNDFAAFVAMLERAFPGGTYYELGRDAVFIGDVLDAFYISIGQPGRVRRLDASAPSFAAKNWQLTYGFLKTNGLDLDSGVPEWPHVIFDTTSFNKQFGVGTGVGGSQSVQLVEAGYRHFAGLHGNVTDLLRYFNFVSVGGAPSTAWPDMRLPKSNVDDYFARQASEIAKQPTSTFAFDSPFYCDLSGLTYTDAWHGPFSVFSEVPNHGVTTFEGRSMALSYRQEILAEMFSIYEVVSKPEFLTRVQEQARLYGFEFPLTRVHQLEAPQKIKKLQIKATKRPKKPTDDCDSGFIK